MSRCCLWRPLADKAVTARLCHETRLNRHSCHHGWRFQLPSRLHGTQLASVCDYGNPASCCGIDIGEPSTKLAHAAQHSTAQHAASLAPFLRCCCWGVHAKLLVGPLIRVVSRVHLFWIWQVCSEDRRKFGRRRRRSDSGPEDMDGRLHRY